jgi:hypothetical protein
VSREPGAVHLFPDKTGSRDFAHEQNTKAPEGAATGASAGGLLGGGLGWLVGIGALSWLKVKQRDYRQEARGFDQR